MKYLLIITLSFQLLAFDIEDVEFRFNYSYATNTGPWDSESEQELAQEEAVSVKLNDYLMSRDAGWHLPQNIESFCNQFNTDEKIRSARILTDHFASHYDPNLAEAPFQMPVSSEVLWQQTNHRLTTGETNLAGTSADHLLAASQYLTSCLGEGEAVVGLERYMTDSGSHHVLTVNDGETVHSFNLSEMHSTRYHPFLSSTVNSDPRAIGIRHLRYDPETGRVIDQRLSELGQILAAVHNGQANSDHFHPAVLQLEGQYRVLTVGYFSAQTTLGEVVRGASTALELRPVHFVNIQLGLSYANTRLANSFYTGLDDDNDVRSNHYLYMQLRGTIDIPDLQLLRVNDHALYLESNVDMHMQVALIWAQPQAGEERGFQHDQFNLIDTNAFLTYRNRILEARVGGGVETSFVTGEQAQLDETGMEVDGNGPFPHPMLRGRYLEAQLTLRGGRLDISAGSRVYFFSYGLNHNQYLAFLDKRRFMMVELGMFTHINELGERDRMLEIEFRRDFSVRGLGIIGLGFDIQTPLTPDNEYRATFGVTVRPSNRVRDNSTDSGRRRRDRR